MFVFIEYLTLDGCFTKIYGHHVMLINHFRHRVRINFPFYLRQSLDTTILALQNDPEGDHACHEGLMVLVMNFLKSKKVDRPHFKKKTLECDTEWTDSNEAYEDDIEEEEVEPMDRKNISPRGLTSKKRKRNEVDYQTKTRIDEDSKEEKWKKTKGKTSRFKTRNSLKKDEKCLKIPSNDDLLIQKKEDLKGKKILT